MLSLEKQLLFLISSAEGIDVKRLVEIYGARQIDHQVVRNALARLKKDGFIRSLERSMYAITERGLDFMTTINRKSLLLDKQWDGQWLTVMFEIPESERKKRDAVRNDLLQLGFGALYKGVYISPWDYSEEVLRFADQYEAISYLTLLQGTFLHRPPTPLQARTLWPLEELNEVYRGKTAWFRSEFAPAAVRLIEEPADGLALFVRFLELGELLADLSLSDPMLPAALHEESWLGEASFREIQRFLKRIADAIPVNSPYYSFISRFLHGS